MANKKMSIQDTTNSQDSQSAQDAQYSQFIQGIIVGTVATGVVLAGAVAINTYILSKPPVPQIPPIPIRPLNITRMTNSTGSSAPLTLDPYKFGGIMGSVGGGAIGLIGSYFHISTMPSYNTREAFFSACMITMITAALGGIGGVAGADFGSRTI